KGGPGSGKSTVALYRIRKVLETFESTLFDPPSILLLTYTKALTKANRDQLHELLGTAARTVSVRTLDEVARQIVDELEPVGEILGETDLRTDETLSDARTRSGQNESIARFTNQYLIEEIFQVIEAQGIKTRKTYLE